MDIIVPAAGLSTRFPNCKPKYLLFDHNNKMMLYRALESYIGIYPITIGILKEHDDIYSASNLIRKELGENVNIVIIPEVTKGPADTVYQILKNAKLDDGRSFMVKDCDNFFTTGILSENFICVNNTQKCKTIENIGNKSFVVTDIHGAVQKIVEKSVISDVFCSGGYGFENSNDFIWAFENIKAKTDEIFVSHVIDFLIQNRRLFFISDVSNYIDVGTLVDWESYTNVQVEKNSINN